MIQHRSQVAAVPGRLMRVTVEFQSEQVAFDVPDDRLVGAWNGPASIAAEDVVRGLRRALEEPDGYPPLRQAVVPGDNVVLPIDPATPGLSAILPVVAEVL